MKDIHKIEVVLEFDNAEDLITTIDNLVGTCQTALLFHDDNKMAHLNDLERDRLVGSTASSIANTLRIAKLMITPLYERASILSPH